MSPVKPTVHSKAPKLKVVGPLTLLVSKTPAMRGAQELSNFTWVFLVDTRYFVWIMLPFCSECYKPSCHHNTSPQRETGNRNITTYDPPSPTNQIKSNKCYKLILPKQIAPKVIPMLAHGCLNPIFVVTISNQSAVSFQTYCHFAELVHLDPHPAV